MKKLMTKDEVKKLISDDQLLILSGSFEVLSDLPKGKWIGGTSTYFIDEVGGTKSCDHIFVEILPNVFSNFKVESYTDKEIANLADNYFSHGFSYLLLPAFSKIHYSYAEKCREYKNLHQQPMMGWVAGFDLDDQAATTGWVFDGFTGEKYNDRALCLHVELKNEYAAIMDTINLFEPGNGDIFHFVNSGFVQKDCYIRGELRNFYDYVVENECDTQLPLVATIKGLQTNVSIKSLDAKNKEVHLYAPAFSDQEYQFASPVGFYDDEFEEQVNNRNLNPTISCNCILNYLYAGLEGKKTANITCPMTFGEISHLLINQTLVCITFVKK